MVGAGSAAALSFSLSEVRLPEPPRVLGGYQLRIPRRRLNEIVKSNPQSHCCHIIPNKLAAVQASDSCGANMSINENELLELNADLMVLIREKQEQGALADAIRFVSGPSVRSLNIYVDLKIPSISPHIILFVDGCSQLQYCCS